MKPFVKQRSLIKSKRRGFVRTPTGDVLPDKGKLNGACNVTACQKPNSAHYQHKDNHAYYCWNCATEINKFAIRVDKIDLFPGGIPEMNPEWEQES